MALLQNVKPKIDMSDVDPNANAKLKNLSEEDLEYLWMMRNPSDDGEKVRYEDIRVYIKNELGFTVAASTLSEFYKWLRLKKRIESARERAEQSRLKLAAEGRLDAAAIEEVSRAVFTAETLESGKVSDYVALQSILLQEREMELKAKKVELSERRIILLENKARAFDEASERARRMRDDANKDGDNERLAILDKVDEILGLKK